MRIQRAHRVSFGEQGAEFFDRCPWATVAGDADVDRYLTAYGVLERWGKTPPGRDDPRYWEAMTVIAAETARVDREALAHKDGDYA